MFREGHTATNEPSTFAFQQAPLEAAKGFAHRDSTACRRQRGARECFGRGDKLPWRDRRRERRPAAAWRGPIVRK